MIDTILSQIFTLRNIIIYLIFLNFFTWVMMGYDKHEAKIHEWRVSEGFLFFLVLIGGGIGGIAGMYMFHHKTRKWYFKFGFPIILIFEIVGITYLKVQGII